MHLPEKSIIFAHSDVGLAITKYLANNYLEDLLQVVVLEEDSDIYRYAKNAGIGVCVFGSDTYNNFIATQEFDTGFLVWWPRIIPKELFTKAKDGFINTHPSLLPYCQGKHYNFWTIVEDCPFGVTLHYVNEEIDTGDVIYQKEIKYDWLDTGETLFKRARLEMVSLFKEFYPLYRKGELRRVKQDSGQGSFHHSSELDAASRLDLSKKYLLKDILNLLRARTFEGHPSCSFEDTSTDKHYEVRISITEKDTSL